MRALEVLAIGDELFYRQINFANHYPILEFLEHLPHPGDHIMHFGLVCRIDLEQRSIFGSFLVQAGLGEMRRQSRPIKPRDLGLIGAEHLRAKFGSIGVASESFCYKKAEVEYYGVPYLAEVAFGDEDRRIITGSADRLIHHDRPTSIKAYSVMEQAYLAASANETRRLLTRR